MSALASDDESAAGTEADTTNMADFPADTADAGREDHAIYSNRNLPPTTNRRPLESRPTGNIDNAIARRPRSGALA